MGKARGVSRRRRKNQKVKFTHRTKMTKKRDKQANKPGVIQCKVIRENWNPQKSADTNLKSMGLSLNPNKLIKPVVEKMEVALERNVGRERDKSSKSKANVNIKPQVLDELEKESKKPSEKNFRFGPQVIKFCIYMIEKYGDDYEAMCIDKINYYQESAGQIRQKIKRFKSIPRHWDSYVNGKEKYLAQLDDMECDEEEEEEEEDDE